MSLPTFHNSFINQYIEFTKPNTESPTAFHVWAALNGIGAILARNAWLSFGHAKMFSNTFVIIVGPPGARKSTSLAIMKRLLLENTTVVFGPTDTGGARQGLLSAMTASGATEEEDTSNDDESYDALDALLSGEEISQSYSNGAISAANLDDIFAEELNPRRINTLYISASEMTSFTGVKQFELINCLSDLYDTDEYKYQLKDSKKLVRNPSLNLIAATTPKSLFLCMPDNAIEQGFMSRTILVYGAEKTKKLAWPKPADDKLLYEIGQILKGVDDTINGEMTMRPDALEAYEYLYNEYEITIKDDRFTHYKERRHAQVLKLAMCFAAMELRMHILGNDVADAHNLLCATEEDMPKALGHYGLNPISIGKQKMEDHFVSNKNEIISDNDLWQMFSRDLTRTNYHAVVKQLVDTGFIKLLWAKYPGTANQVQAYMLSPTALQKGEVRKLVAMTTDEIMASAEEGRKKTQTERLLGGAIL